MPVQQANLSRRRLLGGIAALPLSAAAQNAAPESPGPLKICVFSKHLQWLDWQDAAATAKQIGFDGIDFTVRKGGHVLPERVTEDLPKAVEAAHRAGLETPMITTDIVDTRSPHVEQILRTAGSLGIRHYRWGGLNYTREGNIPEQIAAFKPRVQALAEMNQHYRTCAMYHTHSGPNRVGAPQWDLWMLLHDLDSRWIGVNYDVAHATVEGGAGGWMLSERLLRPLMRGVALKDFFWARNARGEWVEEWCPLGQGMVHLPRFVAMLKEGHFSGPLQLHYEYKAMGGADSGKNTLTVPKETVLEAMRRDLAYTRRLLQEAQL